MPHLRELVKLHQNERFELVGINAYDDAEAVAEGIDEYGVTWPVVTQTKQTPICEQYRVRAFPTYIVLDGEGRIRAKPRTGSQLDAVIEHLLEEQKQ